MEKTRNKFRNAPVSLPYPCVRDTEKVRHRHGKTRKNIIFYLFRHGVSGPCPCLFHAFSVPKQIENYIFPCFPVPFPYFIRVADARIRQGNRRITEFVPCLFDAFSVPKRKENNIYPCLFLFFSVYLLPFPWLFRAPAARKNCLRR